MHVEDLGLYREKPRTPRGDVGWTQMPNDLLEQLPLTELTPLQYKILLVVYRYSIGFNRRHCDRLTLRGIGRKVGREWSAHFREACRLLAEWNMIAIIRPAQRGSRAIIAPITEPWRWRLPEGRGRLNVPGQDDQVSGEELERVVDEFFYSDQQEQFGRVGKRTDPNKEPTQTTKKDIDGRVFRFANERGDEVADVRRLQRITIESSDDDGRGR